MPDNLRTRIIAALRTTKTGRTEFHSYQLDDLADAVIRELGLTPHLAKRIIHGKPDQWVRRLVTDWEIVDE